MKKGLFILLALASTMAFACNPTTDNNGNANSGNKNGNQGITVDPRIVPVAISLTFKKNSDTYHFDVSPPTVYLTSGTQQIQWIISNHSDLDLTDVKIFNFKGQQTNNTDPFKNGGAFGYSALLKRTVDANQFSGTSTVTDTFNYEVTGMLTMADGSKVPIKLDPKVVISGN
ncbi:MAG TPA: hypothetical protein VJZ26_00770 [Blastocatellia bacterium]|nr:hypothetical protein [Blastocatellia bacterium]